MQKAVQNSYANLFFNQKNKGVFSKPMRLQQGKQAFYSTRAEGYQQDINSILKRTGQYFDRFIRTDASLQEPLIQLTNQYIQGFNMKVFEQIQNHYEQGVESLSLDSLDHRTAIWHLENAYDLATQILREGKGVIQNKQQQELIANVFAQYGDALYQFDLLANRDKKEQLVDKALEIDPHNELAQKHKTDLEANKSDFGHKT